MYNDEFELHELEKFFATCFSSEREPGDVSTSALTRERLTAEVVQIKQHLLTNIMRTRGEDAIRRYVQLQQFALIAVMDEIFQHGTDRSLHDCYPELDGILRFLQQNFPIYMNDEAMAPIRQVMIERFDVAEALDHLEQTLRSRNANPAIVEMVLYPLRRFATGPDAEQVSFHRLRHLHYILRHTGKICESKCESEALNRELVQLVLYLNYNSKRSFMQLTEYITTCLQSNSEPTEKIRYLSQLLKEVNQAAVKQGTGYHVNASTLKSRITDYITEELNYWAKAPNVGPIPEIKEKSVPFKLKLDVSVAQLACLLRILTGAGLISNTNTSALIRFIALNCETKKGGISPRSLRIKFYEIKPQTTMGVRKKLKELAETVST